ncbi:M23 family metallopeptidase [Virgifigura deserti]|uniref:M23 family metallopeptidase n=1 Tax=Virgifigura deserti TaxID=2268457 RepID=UPI003CCBE28A
MNRIWCRPLIAALVFLLIACAEWFGMDGARAEPLALNGTFTQGGLVVGETAPGSRVLFNGHPVLVSTEGLFVIGFSRDAPPTATLRVVNPNGTVEERQLDIAPRTYDIQRIDGLPKAMVSPSEAVWARIAAENAAIAEVRKRNTDQAWFADGFVWPVIGPISGIYGSQRILNGEPRRPHYGVDIAMPVGTPVGSPGEGVVVLAEPDLYYTGGTIIIDHGHGLTSALLHLETVTVEVGDHVRPGDPIGTVGATGRATGPHLDWRINLFDARIDPELVVGPMPESIVPASQTGGE